METLNQLLKDASSDSNDQTFENGDVIHEPNDPADSIYLIKSGEVRVYDRSVDGTSRLIEILGPTDWLGSAALGQLPVYGKRAVSFGTSILSRLPVADLRQRLTYQSDMAALLVESLAQRLQLAQREGSRFAFEDCRLRLINTLLRYSSSPAARKTEDGVVLRFTHAQLAEAVGAARETVSLCLTELRHLNMVRTGRNQLRYDPERLRLLETTDASGKSQPFRIRDEQTASV